MKKAAVLIDFTDISEKVALFAAGFAGMYELDVEFIHIAESEDSENIRDMKNKMNSYISRVNENGRSASFNIHFGKFFNVIRPVLENSGADIVIVGTHGKHGLKQNLFGSYILKLIQSIHLPSLVIQQGTEWKSAGLKKALCPVSSHDTYLNLIESASKITGVSGELDIYAIHKTDDLDADSSRNLKDAVSFLQSNNLPHKLIEEDANMYSVGFAKQTLHYVENNSYDLICIHAQVSDSSRYFGEMDKENILFNAMNIPVLCFDGE
ncbi:MAG: universal stress protein [Bacteroidia bacterium]